MYEGTGIAVAAIVSVTLIVCGMLWTVVQVVRENHKLADQLGRLMVARESGDLGRRMFLRQSEPQSPRGVTPAPSVRPQPFEKTGLRITGGLG